MFLFHVSFAVYCYFVNLLMFLFTGARFVENKREARELAEKEGRKLKPQDYLYQYAGLFHWTV